MRKERPSKWRLNGNQDQAPIYQKNTSLSVIKDKRMILYLMVEKQVSYPLTMEIRPYK